MKKVNPSPLSYTTKIQPKQRRQCLSDSNCRAGTIQFGHSNWIGTIKANCSHVRILSEEFNMDVSEVTIANTYYSNRLHWLYAQEYGYNLKNIGQIAPGTFNISYWFNRLEWDNVEEMLILRWD